MESLFIVIFTIVFMGLGSCLLIYSFQQRSRIKRAQNWHTTQAKIQSLDYFDHDEQCFQCRRGSQTKLRRLI